MYMCVSVSRFAHISAAVPLEARRGHQTLEMELYGNWKPGFGCLQEQSTFLITKPSSPAPKFSPNILFPLLEEVSIPNGIQEEV